MTDVTAPPTYKLMRAKKGRMLGGVAAGLARASGMDVTIVRICLGATILTFGLGVPAYILMWVVLPEESPRRGRVIEQAPENIAKAIRITLVVVAALSVINELGGISPFNGPRAQGFGLGSVIGLILLGIGVSVLFSRHRPDPTWWEPSSPPTSASTASRRRPASAGDDEDLYLSDDDDPPTYVGPFRDVVEPVGEALSQAFREMRTTMAESKASRPPKPPKPPKPGEYFDDDEYDDYYDEYDDNYEAYEPAPPRPVAMVTSNGLRDSGGAALTWARIIGWFVVIWFLLAAITVGLGAVFGVVEVGRPVLLGVVALIVWVAVTNTLVHAKFARAILPSLALLLIPTAIAGATVRMDGQVGQYTFAYEDIAARETSFNYAAGQLELLFGDTKFPSETTTTINAHMGTGQILVEVPDDATVTVRTKAGIGAYEVFGQRSHGMSPREKLPTFEGCAGGPKLMLDLDVGIGNIEVKRDNGGREATCKKAA